MNDFEDIDIYDRQGRYDSAKNLLLKSHICKRNKVLILRYVDARKKKIGIERQRKYMTYLRILAEDLGKPFDKATKKDIDELWKKIENKKVRWGGNRNDPKNPKRDISNWSKQDYGRILQMFYQWLTGKEEPKKISGIKLPKVEIKELRPDEILTWDDVITLSKVAMNPRDIALVQVLWDSGFRIEELLTLKLKDVVMVNGGSAIQLHIRKSKTKKRRPVLVRSAPALIKWIDKHPFGSNKEAPLFVKVNRWGEKGKEQTVNNSAMNYAIARKVIRELKARSKLDKPVNPHSFRKSSASYYSRFLSEAEVKTRYGWEQNSRMLKVYCFPDEQEINKKIMKMHGLKIENDEITKEVMPETCQWCNTLNPAGQEYCNVCKRPLDTEKNMVISQIEDKINSIIRKELEDRGLVDEIKEKAKTELCSEIFNI